MQNPIIFSDQKLIERLQFENPWWNQQSIPTVFKRMMRRKHFEVFYRFIQNKQFRRAVVLMGQRRVGKTVMLYHAIDQLMEEGIDPNKILFIGIDNPIYSQLSLQDLLDLFKSAQSLSTLEGSYIFFDEIQYLKDWERHLKVMVDQYPEIKIIVSGSTAAVLQWHCSESGAGRFTDFMLPPFSFQEFLKLKNWPFHSPKSNTLEDEKKWFKEIKSHLEYLNKEFLQFIHFGGYPEFVLPINHQFEPNSYLKNDIIDKVLLRDLPSLYGINDIQELYRFFSYLAYHTGKEFSYDKMSKESGIKKEHIKEYLTYLEAAYLIKVLHKINIHAKHMQQITNFKVYITNPSLRTALFSPIREKDVAMGYIVETAMIAQYLSVTNLNMHYARWKDGEVDLVFLDPLYKPYFASEIKWSNRSFNNPNSLKNLIEFCEQNKIKQANVTTIDQIGFRQFNDIRLNFYPVSIYILMNDYLIMQSLIQKQEKSNLSNINHVLD